MKCTLTLDSDPAWPSCLKGGPASNWEYALAGYWQFLFRYGRLPPEDQRYNARMDAKQHELMAEGITTFGCWPCTLSIRRAVWAGAS